MRLSECKTARHAKERALLIAQARLVVAMALPKDGLASVVVQRLGELETKHWARHFALTPSPKRKKR